MIWKYKRVTGRGTGNDTEGAEREVQDAEGTIVQKRGVAGGSLELAYTVNEDNSQIELCSPGTDIVHVWTRESF